MLHSSDLHAYQDKAIQHILTRPGSMLWLDMGLGKTISALTAINTFMAIGTIQRTLVVAPLRVCQTVWEQEALNWSHVRHLRFKKVIGSHKQRLNALLNLTADVYLINYENLEWLTHQLAAYYTGQGKPFPFQCVVWDEISKMKNSTTNRGKASRKIIDQIPIKIGLTGTPCSNGLADLHGQFLVLDSGARLGTHITHFRERYLYQDPYSRRWTPHHDSQAQIEGLVHDITLQMSAEDYLEVPPFSVNDVMVQFPPGLQKKYEELERDMVTEMETHTIEVFNAASLTNKCLQFANGAVYDEPGLPAFTEVHDLKLDALQDIVEGSGDSPLLVAYAYKSDRNRILNKFKSAVCLSDIKGRRLNQVMEQWNRGEIKMLVGHPASMGHGLNLQHGGHTLVWFGLNWSLDLYEQFNARLARQGQKHPVMCHRVMVDGTVERTVKEALDDKACTQEDLRQAIGKYAATKALPPPVEEAKPQSAMLPGDSVAPVDTWF